MVAVLYLGQNPEVQTRCVCYVVIMESRQNDTDLSYEYKTIKGGGEGRG